MPDKNKDNPISITRSLCPECGAIVDARILEKDGAVVISKSCANHGGFEFPLFEDAGFYRECSAGLGAIPPEIDGCDATGCLTCSRHVDRVKTIMIDATERCNLRCAACFTNTHTTEKRDPTIEEIVSRLGKWKTRPTVLLCGGEPTVREDLPELIRAISALGFVVKAASNGIKLTDMEYVRKLKDAGLGWVLFQFDGFSDEIYRKTRGRDLLAIKEKALANLSAAGIKVCLAFMVVKGLNDGEIGRMIDMAMKSDNIMHIGCTVLSCVGRDEFDKRHATGALDVLRAVERETAGRLNVSDFMRTRKIGNFLFKLTGNLEYQQKTCFHMALLQKRAGGFFPVNRYFSLTGALGNPGGLASLARLYGSLKDWDAITLSGKVKLFTIEDFRAQDTIDLCDANRCNKVYMAEDGYIPPCIYNTKYRPQCWLPIKKAVK
ncbi:MAG: radical SAM protein [bacterium]